MAGINVKYIEELDRPSFKGFRSYRNDEVWIPDRRWADRFGGYVATSLLVGMYEWQEIPSDGSIWESKGFRLY